MWEKMHRLRYVTLKSKLLLKCATRQICNLFVLLINFLGTSLGSFIILSVFIFAPAFILLQTGWRYEPTTFLFVFLFNWIFILTILFRLYTVKDITSFIMWIVFWLFAATSQIFMFSIIYWYNSLIGPSGCIEIIDFWTALYYSIVTWTTLGYGDFQPTEQLRLMAANQALLGYVNMATIFGVISGVTIKRLN